MGSLPVNCRAKGSLATALCTAKEHGRSGLAAPNRPPGLLTDGHSLGWQNIGSLAHLDHTHCRVDEACSRARYGEVFWAVPEWPAAMGIDSFLPTVQGKLAASQAIAALPPSSPHIHGLANLQQAATAALLACDTTCLPAGPSKFSPSSIGGTSREGVTSEPADTQRVADQLEVAASQNSALQSLVRSLQDELGRAAARESALQHQLRSARLHAERLQAAGEAHEPEQASWGRGACPEDLGHESEHLRLTELQLTETALLDALQHEELLMEQIICFQHAQSDMLCSTCGAALAGALPLMSASVERNPAEGLPIASSDIVPAETKTSRALSGRPTAEHTAGGGAMTWPPRLVHARSVIAELSDRLAQLECSNALLQDRLAAGSGDLIRSGPDDQWPVDAFPWQDAGPTKEGQVHARVAAGDVNREMLPQQPPTAEGQDALPELQKPLTDTAEPEPEAHARANRAPLHLQTTPKPRGKEDVQMPAEGSSTLPVPDALGAGTLPQAEESHLETSCGQAGIAGEETITVGEQSHGVRPMPVLATGTPAADRSSGDHALEEQHVAAPASLPALTSMAPEDSAGNVCQPQHAPDVQSHALAIAMSIVSSSEAPATGLSTQDTKQAWKGDLRQARHGALSTESPRMYAQLAAAEQQSASLAATHAELERRLLHAHQQLIGSAGAGSGQVSPPATEVFQGANEASAHAVTQVPDAEKASSAQRQPPVEAAPQRLEGAKENGSRLDEVSSGEARQLAELRAELAERAAKQARVALQLEESERCRERLQQQLLDLWEARALPGAAEGGPCGAPDQASMLPEQAPRPGADVTGSAETRPNSTDVPQAERFQAGAGHGETPQLHDTVKGSAEVMTSTTSVQRPPCPVCGRPEPSAGGEADAALGEVRQGLSEIAALQLAMTQSEAIFLDVERQLTAALEREEAAQARIAALEEQLEASTVSRPILEPKSNAVAAEEVRQGQQSGAPAATAAQSQTPEGQMAVAGEEPLSCCDAQQQTMTPADTPQRVQLLTEQLRRAHSRANDAEAVIETLQGQLMSQQACVTALQSSLAAAHEEADAAKVSRAS